MTTPKTDALMALADRYAFHIPGSQHSDEARAVLLAALQEQAREGEAVANSAILARGRFHAFKGENGEPDDWEWFEEGTNCEHGCIDAVIVRADAIAAPQAAQPDHIADTNKMVPADHVEQHLDMVEQPEQVDWKDQYEKQKRRAEMWIAKYEKDIGPLEKVYPAAQPEQGELTGCACRWDADDNRVTTCVRHQGWLDVVHEWAERAKSAETTLQSAQQARSSSRRTGNELTHMPKVRERSRNSRAHPDVHGKHLGPLLP